jgi:protein TonB
METKKSNRVDLNKQRTSFFSLGLVVALSLCLLAFEYTSIDKKKHFKSTSPELITDIVQIMEIPQPPKPQNQFIQRPQQQTTAQTTVANPIDINTIDNNTPTDDQQSTMHTTDNQGIVFTGGQANTIIDDNEVVDFASEMPTCKECLNIVDEEKRAMCTYACLNKQIKEDIKYPKNPLADGIEGTVYVYFVVDKDGTVSDVSIARGVHPELDAEAMRVVKKFKPFEPGKNLGKTKRVRLIQPIRFSIGKN